MRIAVFLYKLILVCSIGLSATLAHAQYQISGLVLSDTDEAIAFATISLFNAQDSGYIRSTDTDMDGAFAIPSDSGSFYLMIDYIGYQTETISGINVIDADVDLSTVRLGAGTVELDEIVVEGEKSTVQFNLDKRVYNVGSDISNAGGSAEEILDNLPSVQVDIDGTVSLRGSNGVRILINGKPSGLVGLEGSNALQSIQASMIEKVELITNPGAKYEAQGEAGIINIILKKEKNDGLNGSFDLALGYPENLSAGINLNWRRKKWNLFTNLGGRYRKSPGRGNTFQRTLKPGAEEIFRSTSTRTREQLSGSFQFGTEYFLDDKNTFTLSGMYRKADGNNFTSIVYQDLDDMGNVLRESIRTDREEEPSDDIELQYNWTKTFARKGQKLTLDAQYALNDETERSEYNEAIDNFADEVQQRSTNTQDQWRWLLQSDYVHPVSEGRDLEIGVRGERRRVSNDFTVEQLDDELGYQIVDGLNDELAYKEAVYAVYGTYADETHKLSYKLGARMEYTGISTELLESGSVNEREYYSLFPTAHLSYKLDESNQLQASYSRRISRPRFWYLMPFLTFSDSRVRFQGNPDLNPEFTNSGELGYLRFFDKGTFLTSIYYRHRTDVVERVREIDEAGITSIIPVNLSVENAIGIEMNANIEFSPSLSWNINGNFYNSRREGEYKGQTLTAEATTFSGRTMISAKLKDGLDLQTSFNYRAPRNTTQGRSLSSYSWDMGVSKDIWDKKGTISFSIRDLLNTRLRRSIVDTDDLYSESLMQWRPRSYILQLSYRLRQQKKRGRSTGGGAIDGGGEF